MKKFFQLSFLFLFFGACNTTDKKIKEDKKPENEMEAASQFIRAALDGNYAKARSLLLKDSTNMQMINIYENNYNTNFTPDDKRAYKDASIRFLKDTHKLNDSITIVYFSNSYKNRGDSLKIVKLNGEWLIDLNFTFQPIKDSLPQ